MAKTLVLLALLAGPVAADKSMNFTEQSVEAFDLEVEVQGRRQLFPLLPGTKCPAGHTCRARHTHRGVAPMMSALKDNLKSPQALQTPESWHAMNNDLNTVVNSNDFCSRRHAMSRAAGLAAGLSLATVSAPAYAAAETVVQMGTDSGGLQFVPAKSKICKGDSVKWVINKAGPHNVVFDEEAIPEGVSQASISMEGTLGDEGESFSKKFDVAGSYDYYCEPHRGAGMNGNLQVA